MQTSTQRPARTRKPTPAPFSATAARLIEHIQAEAREKLLEDLSAKDAIVVLHGFDVASKRVRHYGYDYLVVDNKGNQINMRRRHVIPESWVGNAVMEKFWHPAYWTGHELQIDAAGRTWEREIGTHICDDFGNLVQVAA